ncbi:MAG: helix-hairpin-helix domain-containing protein, partial [Acidimicrobiales bacterium]
VAPSAEPLGENVAHDEVDPAGSSGHRVTSRDVMAMLRELVTLTTLAEESPQSFKVRAYENACLALEADGSDVASLTMGELTKIKGVGKATASKIRELVDTGRVEKLVILREKFPPGYVELSRIPGLGPKTLRTVRDQLGVMDVEGLKAAIAAEQLRTLPGLGKTSEEKIAKAIDRLGMSGKDRRTPIAEALPLADRLVASTVLRDGRRYRHHRVLQRSSRRYGFGGRSSRGSRSGGERRNQDLVSDIERPTGRCQGGDS